MTKFGSDYLRATLRHTGFHKVISKHKDELKYPQGKSNSRVLVFLRESLRMDDSSTIKLDRDMMAKFREWANLDMQSITWQGRYKSEFEEFWDFFFAHEDAADVFNKFKIASSFFGTGTIISWISWIRDKFLAFIFINFPIDTYSLSKLAGLEVGDCAISIRNFFSSLFPYLDDEISELFQVGNMASTNLNVDFSKIKKIIGNTQIAKGSERDEIMTSLEITLYSGLAEFRKQYCGDTKDDLGTEGAQKKHRARRVYLKVAFDFIALLVISVFLIWVVQFFNKWYEKRIAEQFSVYEPQFTWLDKNLTYKDKQEVVQNGKIKSELDEIDEIINKSQIDEVFFEEERFDTESEVVLTSWDNLPKDFEVANLEESNYEERKKGGFRDTRFGNRKAYRVMMKAVNPDVSKNSINTLIERYEVVKGDKVMPGTNVPGGVYYNLFVPREFLKEFMAQVMDIGEAVLYESKTRGFNPPGKNKVFIWIKNI